MKSFDVVDLGELRVMPEAEGVTAFLESRCV